MFKIKSRALSGNKVLFNRRGQVSLLFALMMPIFLLMIGVTLDLGWYYLNVSRLQNAADAAAVAGANALREDEYFRDYKNVKLIGKYPAKDSNKYRGNSIYELTAIENTNVIAEEYVAKNLSSNKDNIINSWTKTEVGTEEGLYTKDNNLYYVVKLKEKIRHFFLPGWFDDMTAPVTAVALLSKTAIKGDSEDNSENPTMPPTMPTSLLDFNDSVFVEPEKLKEIEKVLNDNMIVGNWEVQNHYKSIETKNAYARDEYGDIIANPETGEVTPATQFESRFGYEVYKKRWNHFQDMKNHYKVAGATYRTETINVWDDVVDTDNDGVADTWGNGKSGMSNVVATKASTNPNKDTDNASGKPYLEYELDSINVDFKPEIAFVENAAEEDWDFKLGYLTTSCNHSGTYEDWTSKGSEIKNIGILRIHSTINIGKAYKERTETYREKDADGHLIKDTNGNLIPDILWGRIESEPMLFYPDKVNGLESLRKRVYGLSSVRQIIINVKNSNYAEDDRPVILFYDGPETNDIYKEYEERTDVLHNKSLPVILNLNADFRGVLYAPNSPVVVIGNNKGNFDGFVVAKEYKRLKTTADFEAEVAADNDKYTRYNDDFTTNAAVANPYYVADSTKYASGYTAEPETINWKYTKITENGIEMYVDNYGNVQYMDYPDAPTKYGTYDNFGRTTFSTHGYTVLKTSANNMLLSGR